MSDLNKIFIVGRLTADPEFKKVGESSLVSFSIANGRKFKSNNETKEETSFLNCEAWGKLAKIIREYCNKGKQVVITGRLKQDRWKDNNGANHSRIKIFVEELQMIGGNKDKQAPTNQAYESMNDYGYEVDDDFPF